VVSIQQRPTPLALAGQTLIKAKIEGSNTTFILCSSRTAYTSRTEVLIGVRRVKMKAWLLRLFLASAFLAFGGNVTLFTHAAPEGVETVPDGQMSKTDAADFLALAKDDLPAFSKLLSAAGSPHPDAALDAKSKMTALSQGIDCMLFWPKVLYPI